MRKVFAICIALAVIGLSGCDLQQWFNSFIPKEEAAIGQRYLEDVRTHNFQPVEDKFNPSYKNAQMPAAMEKLASIFPKETPKNIKVVSSNTFTMTRTGQTTYNFTYEYEFPHHWVLGHIYFSKTGNNIQINRMDVIPLKASLEEINAFTLANKTPVHYAFLTSAVVIALFTIITAIVCFRTPIPRRKWLWIIFVLFGFGQATLNWTTGVIGWNPISILLFGAGYVQQFYGPAIIQIGFPLGAIIFWFRRRSWKSAAAKGTADMRAPGKNRT